MIQSALWWRRVSHAAVSLCVLFLLGACAAMAPEPQAQAPDEWPAFAAHQQQLQSWTVTGRLGVQSEHEGGSFDLHWQQQAETYTVRLIAPLGQGTVLIHGDAEGVSIRLPDGRSEHSRDPDTLFMQMTGITLPVASLRDWLRGLPVVDAPVDGISWDPSGQLYRLKQLGWRIEMSGYRSTAGYILPSRFYLEHLQQQDLSVRLVIRQWTIPPNNSGAAT